jgi:hypothetical protein
VLVLLLLLQCCCVLLSINILPYRIVCVMVSIECNQYDVDASSSTRHHCA